MFILMMDESGKSKYDLKPCKEDFQRLGKCQKGRAILILHRNPGFVVRDVPAPTDKDFHEKRYDYLDALHPHSEKIALIFVGHSHRYDRHVWQGIEFYDVTTAVGGIVRKYCPVDRYPPNGSATTLCEDAIFQTPGHDLSCKTRWSVSSQRGGQVPSLVTGGNT